MLCVCKLTNVETSRPNFAKGSMRKKVVPKITSRTEKSPPRFSKMKLFAHKAKRNAPTRSFGERRAELENQGTRTYVHAVRSVLRARGVENGEMSSPECVCASAHPAFKNSASTLPMDTCTKYIDSIQYANRQAYVPCVSTSRTSAGQVGRLKKISKHSFSKWGTSYTDCFARTPHHTRAPTKHTQVVRVAVCDMRRCLAANLCLVWPQVTCTLVRDQALYCL